ncbi:MAG TPA: type II secretion system protein GspC [Gammaproteobacteria bacterium]|nr:type II secretion system protein GspC [Gammaproteobacteria bacterium]
MVSFAIPYNDWRQWLSGGGSRVLVRVVNLLLVLWLAWLLAGLTWALVGGDDRQAAVQAVPSVQPVVRRQPLLDPRQIAGWHLFGVAGRDEPLKKAPVNAPETRLKLTLRGVFSSDDKVLARAIVADPRGKEMSYGIGDPLPGGAKLSEIYPDRIILERSGRFETLRLPRDRTPSAAPARRSRPVPGDRNAALQRYRSEIKRNPNSFLNYVRATPARQNGKFVGFRLQEGKKRGVLKELGLRPGDIVTGVNGIAIDNPARGIDAMRALGEGQDVNVTLMRGGQELSLNFTLPGP